MFLIKDRRLGMDNYVFTQTDPRAEGYRGDVVENVALEYDMNDIHSWSDGETRPEPCLGRDPTDENRYKVFKFPADLQAAGFELVHSSPPFVTFSWPDYRTRYYPVPERYATSMTQEEWFDFLEETDAATRIRKSLNKHEKPHPGSSRDHIAEWVAKRHMGADGGIHEVWFLRAGSPVDEIRLLEVSERYTGSSSRIEPVDFGLDLDGATYKLLVADVSTEQLEFIKANPLQTLPDDWKIEGALIWGRRGSRL